MSYKYPSYQMTDGRTRLSAEYFNPVWKDLDARLDKLEQLKDAQTAAIQALTGFGLERIDATLQPVLTAAEQALSESQALLTDLQGMIAEADIPAQIATAMGAFIADVNEALDSMSSDFTDQLESLQTQLDEVRTLAYAGL